MLQLKVPWFQEFIWLEHLRIKLSTLRCCSILLCTLKMLRRCIHMLWTVMHELWYNMPYHILINRAYGRGSMCFCNLVICNFGLLPYLLWFCCYYYPHSQKVKWSSCMRDFSSKHSLVCKKFNFCRNIGRILLYFTNFLGKIYQPEIMLS